MKTKNLWIFMVGLLLMGSCKQDQYIFQDSKILNNNWEKNDAAKFTFNIQDTSCLYRLAFVLRNNNDYPYSNIYFFTTFKSPKGIKIVDTVEYQLAFADGNWIGTQDWKGIGVSEVKQNLLIYKENFSLRDTGRYELTVKQGMRKDTLKGLEDISLIIEKRTYDNKEE